MNQQIYREASEWLVELRVGDIDPAARQKLDAWFRVSPEHIRAFLELSAIWEEGADRDLDRAHSTDDLIARARAAATNVVPFESAPGEAEADSGETAPLDAEALHPMAQPALRAPNVPPAAAPWPASRAPYVRRFAIAASLAALGMLALVVYSYLAPTYATGVGEQRTVSLPDGSAIELNARSRIRVHYSKSERDVELLAGQALFKVAHDEKRPFNVASDAMRVRAVGTQFDVYRKSSGTTVTVVEGRVAILPVSSESGDSFSSGDATTSTGGAGASAQAAPAAAILLSAGEQATVSPSHVDKPTHADVAAATAWTQRELVFDATPLPDVAQEFNRYNVKPLVVIDERLKDFHVTGVFSSTDPSSLLEFLRAQRGIAIEETDTAIRITRR